MIFLNRAGYKSSVSASRYSVINFSVPLLWQLSMLSSREEDQQRHLLLLTAAPCTRRASCNQLRTQTNETPSWKPAQKSRLFCICFMQKTQSRKARIKDYGTSSHFRCIVCGTGARGTLGINIMICTKRKLNVGCVLVLTMSSRYNTDQLLSHSRGKCELM